MPVDYENFSLTAYKDPRTAVGMVKKGEYVLLVADGRGSGGSRGLNQREMNAFKSFGAVLPTTWTEAVRLFSYTGDAS